MLDNVRKILFISSANPLKGPGTIALDYVAALQGAGYDVTFLTKFKVDGNPEFKYVCEKPEYKFSNFRYKLWRKLKKPDPDGRHCLFYKREGIPPVKISKVLSRIENDYDLVLIFFWQELLSYSTIEAIYDRMKGRCQIGFLCADYSPMTGGCHFMDTCQNYKAGCGNCDMIGSRNPNDFSHKNVKDRIRINNKVKPLVFTNLYMRGFFEKSPVMQSGAVLCNLPMILNLEKFRPLDQKESRRKLNIPEDKFVIFFGCQSLNDERKGMKYLLSALKSFGDKLSDVERDSIMVVTAGHGADEISHCIPFEQKHFGYVSVDELPLLYSSSNVFLSPSVNDAGPSMVNQSLACGTPVVSFEMGTAIEVVKEQGTGICVPLRDSGAFADAVYAIYKMDEDSYSDMRHRSRQIAEKYHSFASIVENIENALECNSVKSQV